MDQQRAAVAMINLALKKPASQSSTSQWSKSRITEEDACGANNDEISGEMGFHTNIEQNPWWQVDLEDEYLIHKIVIFNRHHEAQRLKHFSLFRSLDGREWKKFFRKIDNTVFGEKDDRPYVAEIAGIHPARFVRVRLDGYECLHFNECQIFGEPIDPFARNRIMEEEAHADQARLAAPIGRNGRMAEVGGFTVFVDTDRYSASIVSSLDNGSYESRERSLIIELVQPGDRIIEAGTAIGIVSMTAATIVGAENVISFDANSDIVEDARENFRRNDLSRIESRVGVLKCRANIRRPDETENFYIDGAFWASRLDATSTTHGIVKAVQVPVFCLEDEISSHKSNILVCDIEGGEVSLLTQADLTGIRLIIMETHYWAAGEYPTDAMMRKLIVEGFAIHLGYSGHNIIVLRR